MSDWEGVYGCAWNSLHLFRYDPDPNVGGPYLVDQEGGCWTLRTCAICGLQERQRAESHHESHATAGNAAGSGE